MIDWDKDFLRNPVFTIAGFLMLVTLGMVILLQNANVLPKPGDCPAPRETRQSTR